MKRVGLTIALACAVFAAVLVAYFPASWLRGYLPKNVTCTDLAGTAWDGQCLGMTVPQGAIGDVSWDLSGWRVLSGKLVGTVGVTRSNASARSDLALDFGGTGELTNLQARVPLDPAIAAALPANYRGDVMLDFKRIGIAKGRLTALKGTASARNLRQVGSRPMAFGNYDVTFDATAAADGSLTGNLTDRGGPLAVLGTIRITPEPGYEVNGTVTARADAAQSLKRQIEFLGLPDPSGARSFSVAGTL